MRQYGADDESADWSHDEWSARDARLTKAAKERWPGRKIRKLPVFCKSCDAEISPERVFLIPEAVHCVRCAGKMTSKKIPRYVFVKNRV